MIRIPEALKRAYQDCSRVLANLGLVDPDPKASGIAGTRGPARATARMDANETMMFTRQLEAIRTRIIDDVFPTLKSKVLIPEEPGVDPGAQSFTWRRMSRIGVFKFIAASKASDLPSVEMYGTETTTPIRRIGGKYGWDTEELRATMMAGVPLTSKKASMAREAYERKVDAVIALGDSSRGIPGVLTDTNIPIISAGINGDWEGAATAQEMLDDLHALANAVWNQSLQTAEPDTITLPPALYAKISTKRMSDFDSRTVLQTFLASSTFIKNVDYWLPCVDAAANGTDDRAFVYRRHPDVISYIENLKFQSLPPQANGLAFEVPCEGKTGGAIVSQPYACAYCDVLN